MNEHYRKTGPVSIHPLFYLMAAATSSLATIAIEEPDLALRLWTYRLISVVVTALLPITYYLIASELTSNKGVRLASAVLPLCIPGITLHDGSMVNTDALLMFLTSVSILMGLRIAKGDLSLRNAVALGVFTGLAALTKGHALFLIPVLVVAYLIPLSRHKQLTRQWMRSALVTSGITLVVGGWWWIRNLLVYGMIQPVRTPPDLPVGAPTLDVLDWLTEASQRLVGNFWGGGLRVRRQGIYAALLDLDHPCRYCLYCRLAEILGSRDVVDIELVRSPPRCIRSGVLGLLFLGEGPGRVRAWPLSLSRSGRYSATHRIRCGNLRPPQNSLVAHLFRRELSDHDLPGDRVHARPGIGVRSAPVSLSNGRE